MSTIWGVGYGDLGEFGVSAIFTSKETAQAYLGAFKALYYDAELVEFELDPEPPETARLTSVRIFKNGDVWEEGTRTRRVSEAGFRGYVYGKHEIMWAVFTDNAQEEIAAAKAKCSEIGDAGLWGDVDGTRALLEIAQ